MTTTVIKVNQDPTFRQRLAKAIVAEAYPNYCGGWHYADPDAGKVYVKSRTAAPTWNLWNDNDVVIDINCLVPDYDFDPTVNWKEAAGRLPDYRAMVAAYLESEGEQFEENGDISEWVDPNQVIIFARIHSEEWTAVIESEEKLAYELAYQFALESILDEVELEIENA